MMPPPLRLETARGPAAIAPLLPALSRLRIAVFREWPYLYEGDARQEAEYLSAYAESPGAAMVLALDAEEPVGVSTCQPMEEADAAIRAPFLRAGIDPAAVCYFGESVLLPAYRGRGAGVGFFAAREAHARALGLTVAAFAAVVRNANDPRTPPGHVPLDDFWRRRGYSPRPDLSFVMEWREIGDDRETPHSLSFWMKDLAAAAPPDPAA
jgi:GNAT superfamily N-acetyltransferase